MLWRVIFLCAPRSGAQAAHPGQTAGAGARAARLCGLGLTSLSDLSLVRLLGIRELDLSDNELSDLDGVQILHGLTTLHANRCRLRSLAALAAMPHLLALSICDNGLPRVWEALQPLATARPALASLQASGNSHGKYSPLPPDFLILFTGWVKRPYGRSKLTVPLGTPILVQFSCSV